MTFEDLKIALPVALVMGFFGGFAWSHLKSRKAKKRGDRDAA